MADARHRAAPDRACRSSSTSSGLDWPVTGDIEVIEVHTPLLEGYAGIFHTDERRIEISEDLDELTILHEASHAWFNDEPVRRALDRRGARRRVRLAGPRRGLDRRAGPRPGLADRRRGGPAQRLDVPRPDRRRGDPAPARRTATTRRGRSVRALVADAGEAGMRDVLGAASRHETAYVGAGPAEKVAGRGRLAPPPRPARRARRRDPRRRDLPALGRDRRPGEGPRRAGGGPGGLHGARRGRRRLAAGLGRPQADGRLGLRDGDRGDRRGRRGARDAAPDRAGGRAARAPAADRRSRPRTRRRSRTSRRSRRWPTGSWRSRPRWPTPATGPRASGRR